MKIKHLLEEINQLVSAGLVHPLGEIAIDDIEISGNGDLFFRHLNEDEKEEVDRLKKELEEAEGEIEGLEDEREKITSESEAWYNKICEYKVILSNIKNNEGQSFGELLTKNEELEKEISLFKESNRVMNNQYKLDQETIKKLRSRKNKVEVKKSLTTGRLRVEWAGENYELVKVEIK